MAASLPLLVGIDLGGTAAKLGLLRWSHSPDHPGDSSSSSSSSDVLLFILPHIKILLPFLPSFLPPSLSLRCQLRT